MKEDKKEEKLRREAKGEVALGRKKRKKGGRKGGKEGARRSGMGDRGNELGREMEQDEWK